MMVQHTDDIGQVGIKGITLQSIQESKGEIECPLQSHTESCLPEASQSYGQ